MPEGERLTATLSQVFDSLCNLELSVFAPPVQGWWSYFPGPPDLPGTVGYAPIVTDQGGSMEIRGAQLSFVARTGGAYRIRVRGTESWNCPRYQLTATTGAMDADQPPEIH